MARLLIFWTRPDHLSVADAEAWAREELEHVLAVEDVARAQLTRLKTASLIYPRPWDWLLELELAPETDCAAWLEGAARAEWLGDLRLLGMRPSVMVAGDGCLLAGEGA